MYQRSFKLFSKKLCPDCPPILHYQIKIAENDKNNTYSVGFDLNIYSGFNDNGYRKKEFILGRLLPTEGSGIRTFVIEIFSKGLLGTKCKKYYIKDGWIYRDEQRTKKVGSMPGMTV
jgi:hypothetical protein